MTERAERWGALFGFTGAVALAAAAGAVATKRGKRGWYGRLDKPGFTPPDWLFGPVWTTLYGLMATSAYRVWRAAPSAPRRRALGLWALQLGLNAAWSPLFFGRHRPVAALADLGALLLAIGGYTASARRVDRPAAVMMAPYLLWSTYAGLLNAEIVRRNPARV